MNIVFFGSGDFAATHLNRLLASGHRVAGCVTKVDKPQGRGLRMVLSPVKEIALANGIAHLAPETFKDPSVIERLKAFTADLFVVVAYGKILTPQILSIPKIFCVNVHGSLLPKYRGAAPINWAIVNGEQKTGVTVMKMTVPMDAGDVIAQEMMDIGPQMTSVELRAAMARRGAELLVKTLDAIAQGKHQLTPQDHAQATFAPKLTKEMGKITWSRTAADIDHQIRGLQPWPGAYAFHHGKTVKILKAVPGASSAQKAQPGQVLSVDKTGITVACGQGALVLKEVLPEAGKPMPAAAFAAGHRIAAGTILN
ncbi:MAG: methionyl-tRNA formyltransferase [Candidatus Omnitrophota bacterium]|nr:methionyl-tRNA formyltransferase [Candidatus Omnitrophota bacterium]